MAPALQDSQEQQQQQQQWAVLLAILKVASEEALALAAPVGVPLLLLLSAICSGLAQVWVPALQPLPGQPWPPDPALMVAVGVDSLGRTAAAVYCAHPGLDESLTSST
jgi:hypothetical protein